VLVEQVLGSLGGVVLGSPGGVVLGSPGGVVLGSLGGVVLGSLGGVVGWGRQTFTGLHDSGLLLGIKMLTQMIPMMLTTTMVALMIVAQARQVIRGRYNSLDAVGISIEVDIVLI
jgi:type III secretory pathway component EscS